MASVLSVSNSGDYGIVEPVGGPSKLGKEPAGTSAVSMTARVIDI
jgi:hypothetical protein